MANFKDFFLIVALQKCNDPLFIPPPVQDVSVSYISRSFHQTRQTLAFFEEQLRKTSMSQIMRLGGCHKIKRVDLLTRQRRHQLFFLWRVSGLGQWLSSKLLKGIIYIFGGKNKVFFFCFVVLWLSQSTF